MTDARPGLNPRRLVRLMRTAVERCELDLSGKVVLTEAASGAYAVTPILAAMAGAERCYAVSRSSRYGTVEEVKSKTVELARLANCEKQIEIIGEKSREIVSIADVVTNSGHLRPLDSTTISWVKPTGVIPLMYEAWEYRPGDVDLLACQRRGILVAGTNERHPAVDVFSFLGPMAAKLLMDAGIAVYGSRILLLCDNPFASFIDDGLRNVGAVVDLCANLPGSDPKRDYDAILVALKPGSVPVLSAMDADLIAKNWPGIVVAQFWGDIDRLSFQVAGVDLWPSDPPGFGHMGILPSGLGPEPIVRLQSGGLKVGEVLLRSSVKLSDEDAEFVQRIGSEKIDG